MNGHVLLQHLRAACFILLTCCTHAWSLKMGVENLGNPVFKVLTKKQGTLPRVGLISNQTGKDQSGRRTVDILQQEGMRIIYILAPEHGFDGKAPAGQPIVNSVDQKTGISIVSIYGHGGDSSIAGKRLDPATLKKLDVLIYDIQDSGMRHYTYISTMLCALEAAAEYNKPIYILDRPNLLGINMEGPLVDTGLKSFISIAPIPLRHGMTAGELARYFNAHLLKKPACLHVIPLKEYKRIMRIPFLQALSPNLPTKQSLYGYSFLGILGEIRPFEVAVGTPLTFQAIMLPDSEHFPPFEWKKLSVLLKKYGIRSYHETLMKRECPYTGLRLKFPENARFASFDLLLKVLDFFKKRGIAFSFSPLFDKAVGTNKIRKWYENSSSLAEITAQVRTDLQEFYKKAQSSFLYRPYPQIKS